LLWHAHDRGIISELPDASSRFSNTWHSKVTTSSRRAPNMISPA